MKHSSRFVFALAALICTATPVWAATTPPEKSLSAKVTLGDVLNTAQQSNQTVQVVLRNGTIYNAKVKDVSKHAVVLTNLSGKSFFDAYVLLNEIASVEIQMRSSN